MKICCAVMLQCPQWQSWTSAPYTRLSPAAAAQRRGLVVIIMHPLLTYSHSCASDLFIYLSVCLSVCLYIALLSLSLSLYIYIYISLSVYLSVHLSILFSLSLSLSLSLYQKIYFFLYLICFLFFSIIFLFPCIVSNTWSINLCTCIISLFPSFAFFLSCPNSDVIAIYLYICLYVCVCVFISHSPVSFPYNECT